MNSRPATGVDLPPVGLAGSSAASSSRISACSGSVSWNSSTKMCVNRCWKPRRTSGVVADEVARLEQQVEEVERAGARLQLFVARDGAAQLLLQQRREIGIGVHAKLVEAAPRRLVERRSTRCARHAVARSRCRARAAPCEKLRSRERSTSRASQPS